MHQGISMPSRNNIHPEEFAIESFLNGIYDIIKDLKVAAEINRLCKNEHGRLTAFGDAALTEGINRGTPTGLLARMLGITKQALWARNSSTITKIEEEEEVESEEGLYTVRNISLLRSAGNLSRSALRLRLLLKRPKGNRLSPFGREFLIAALKNNVDHRLIASILDVSPSYINLFINRNLIR